MNNWVFERSSGFAGYRNTKTGEWKETKCPGGFISLKDFLAQEDPHRIHYMTGRQFLCYYQLAKASYLQFGEDGPPIGAKVITYFAGHGGMGHNTRIFEGNYCSNSDSDYFELNDPSAIHVGTGISLVEKETWWKHIAPIDPEIKDFGGLPPFLTKKLRHTELETMIAFVCGR